MICTVVEGQIHERSWFSTRLPPYLIHVSYPTLHMLCHEFAANILHVCYRHFNDLNKLSFIVFQGDSKNLPSDQSNPKPSQSRCHYSFPIKVKTKPYAEHLKRLPDYYIDYAQSNEAKFTVYAPRKGCIRLQKVVRITLYPKIPKSTPYEATKSSQKPSKHQREVIRRSTKRTSVSAPLKFRNSRGSMGVIGISK